MNIAIGISGGVDSAVAALLLKEEGHNLTGVLMTIRGENDYPEAGESSSCGKGCYTADITANIRDAQSVCDFLGIPLHIIDCSEYFSKYVMEYFRREYLAGRTPNPCIACNENIKFGILPALLEDAGVDFAKFATGHYCRIEYNSDMKRYLLKKGTNPLKDQSYFLYRLNQKQLEKACFPLGEMTKENVRKIAEEAGLPVTFKAESQDFYSGSYGDLISTEESVGDIVDINGKVLGRHRGIWNYTIGQRKGLGIAHTAPLYVVKIDPEKNEVVLAEREHLAAKGVTADNVNLIYETLPERLEAKIRSASAGAPCDVVSSSEESFSIQFHKEQYAVTPGQSVVLYDGDYVVGGGIIRDKQI